MGDTQKGNVIQELINRDWPLALKFTPDNQYLVSAGRTERVHIWDISKLGMQGAKLAQNIVE